MLLNRILKAFTNTLLEELNKTIQIREEAKQITEKSLEFNKLAYMCFVDMTAIVGHHWNNARKGSEPDKNNKTNIRDQ